MDGGTTPAAAVFFTFLHHMLLPLSLSFAPDRQPYGCFGVCLCVYVQRRGLLKQRERHARAAWPPRLSRVV